MTLKKIKKRIKYLVTYLPKKVGVYSLYCLRRKGELKNVGWFRSFRDGMPVDSEGNPILWMNYAIMHFIEKRINQEMTVFEYGCGNSTFWWANRTKQVVSCEHSKKWYEKMKYAVPANVELYHVDLQYGGEYSKKVSEYSERFDIIVIDGRDRVNCAKNCLIALKKDGVIIWDNSNREYYQNGYQCLLKKGYKRIDFKGMGPVTVNSQCASIFYKTENCMGI